MTTSVGTTITQASGTSTAVSCTDSGGVLTAGMAAIFVLACNTTPTITDNNGSTVPTSDGAFTGVATGATVAIYHRIIQAGDPTTWKWTLGSSQRWSLTIIPINDPNTSSFWDVAPSDTVNVTYPSGSPPFNAANITTANANSINFQMDFPDASATSITADPSTDGSGYTRYGSAGGQSQPVDIVYKTIATAGTVTGGTFAQSASTNSTLVSIAINANTGGGGVTVALTGQSSSFSTGSIASALSLALSGSNITSTEGSIVVSTSLGLIGDAATFTAGSPVASLSKALSGQSGVFSGGALTPNYSLSLSGSSATFSTGFVNAGGDVTVSLTGQGAVFATGLISPSSNIQIAGQSLTAALGNLVPSNVAAIIGQRASYSAGVLVSQLSLTLSGQSSSFSIGALTPSSAISLIGNSATFSAGIVNAGNDVTVSLSGQSASFVAGSIKPSLTTALNGVSGAFSEGQIVPQLSLALAGQSSLFAPGSIVTSASVGLAGQRSAYSTGTVTAYIPSQLINPVAVVMTVSQGSSTMTVKQAQTHFTVQ